MNKTNAYDPISHIQHTRRLLQMEYDCEKAEFERQTQSMGVARKVKRGMCWHPVSVGRSFYNSLNQLVVEIERSTDVEIEHGFEFGKPICFFSIKDGGEISYFPFKGTVSYADERRMVAVMPSQQAIVDISAANALGVQLYFDETSYQAMFEALSAVEKAKDNRLSELRDIMLGKSPISTRTMEPISYPWLNKSQEKAVNLALNAKDVAIVHGPPGTGKTTTLVETIYETLRREPQVLVCAQSNTAVDWICEQLVDRGVNVLRIGNPSRVNDKMLSFTYERRFESHESYPQLWAIRKEIRQLRQGMRKRSAAEKATLHNRLHKLRTRASDLEAQINGDLFNAANVIASTLVSSNHRLLYGYRFGTLFIDEAAQALEAACWIAIRKADRVIFAGDHQQLPPTIKSMEAAHAGLSRTLMEIAAQNKPQCVSLLTMQYRMHQAIMKFSSEWFYEGMLTAAPEVKSRSILDFDRPISWIDTSEMGFKEEFIGESFGRINKPEADLLLQTLTAYIEHIGAERVVNESIDFGIISPYKAQVQYLRQRIKSSSALKPFRHLMSVNTVDGFQGQERDAIFISLVRANDDGQIGFLSDLRRMNVAITRARMKLVILGDASTLAKHRFYAKLLKYIIGTDADRNA